MKLISDRINPKIDFIMNFTLFFSLFYILIIIPYSFSKSIRIKIFGVDFIIIAMTVFLIYLTYWIYNKKRVYSHEKRRKIKTILREM